MKAIAVIPARLASTRLPRKMLREIDGRPLVGVVYEAVRASTLLAEVIVATDSAEIVEVCREHGWQALMTSPAHRSGTERVHEVSSLVSADVYINVQGDEPLARAEHIARLLGVMKDPEVQVGTLMTPAAEMDIPNPNAVKVVADANGRAQAHRCTARRPHERWSELRLLLSKRANLAAAYQSSAPLLRPVLPTRALRPTPPLSRAGRRS